MNEHVLTTQVMVVKEYSRVRISPALLNAEEAEGIWARFSDKIAITPPSFQTGGDWELTSLGWVGYLPISERLHLSLLPKIPLSSLFSMWEVAYRLPVNFLDDEFPVATLQEFYEKIARLLAKLILKRASQGYYRDYLAREADLASLRGRLDLQYMLQHPWQPKPRCHFHEHTADLEDNQILAWTMFIILRSGFCSQRSIPLVQQAYRSLGHLVTLRSFNPEDCLDRLYNRLNEDYSPMHALCRFFLENIGPEYSVGDHKFMPFLIDMAKLFEMFVAEWLCEHLPRRYSLSIQPSRWLDADRQFIPDMVIYDREENLARWVLDTKYKNPDQIQNRDISQVGFYAQMLNSTEAVLVYPAPPVQPLDSLVNSIRLRSMCFSLWENLEENGELFLRDLGV